MTRVELLREHQDTGRRVVPLNTGRVQIGCRWTPPATQTQAQWIERHARRGYSAGWWIAMCVVAALAAFVIVRTA